MNGAQAHPLLRPDALVIENLSVSYATRDGGFPVVRQLNLRIPAGASYGLVGESGSGKSTVALAVMRYLPRAGRVTAGSIAVDGSDLLAQGPEALRRLRSSRIAMVYQDPARALNPRLRIGLQMTEVFRLQGATEAEAGARAANLLQRVRIADPARVMALRPHEISGGMQQRVIIAMALAASPALLILDEPTTGLDATVEAEVLELIAQLRDEAGMASLFISHSLSVIARMCDTVGVLYAGELVEQAPQKALFASPRHPYTAALMRCAPRFGYRKQDGPLTTIAGLPPRPSEVTTGCRFAPRCPHATDTCRRTAPPLTDDGLRLTRCHYPDLAALPEPPAARTRGAGSAVEAARAPLLDMRRVSKSFERAGRTVPAVHEVSLELLPGETLGLVGESGSGKSTLARLLLGLEAPDQGGRIELDGEPLAPGVGQRSRRQLQALQMVFQNPGSALNRAHRVRRLLERALAHFGLSRGERRERVLALIGAVRLDRTELDVKPRALSGGLQQRVAIARALAGRPRVIVCDEPTSALDVSVQASIVNLLAEVQARERVSYVFISHDLSLVYYLADRIAVLYLGRLVEQGPAETVFRGPHHPYTEALLAAYAAAGDASAPAQALHRGTASPAVVPPTGCIFQTRCPRKIGPICEQTEPPLQAAGPGHAIGCHLGAADLQRLQRRP
jgi:peptide/nickel transport system ATP-binding protein